MLDKVYVVTNVNEEYDEGTIFTTEDLAKDYIKKMAYIGDEHYEINIKNVNPLYDKEIFIICGSIDIHKSNNLKDVSLYVLDNSNNDKVVGELESYKNNYGEIDFIFYLPYPDDDENPFEYHVRMRRMFETKVNDWIEKNLYNA